MRKKVSSTWICSDSNDEESSALLAAPARRRKSGAAAKGRLTDLNFAQRFLIFALRNPWVGMTLFFVCVWMPLSFVFRGPMMIADLAIMGLCFVGFVVGLLLALVGVTIRNPFQILTVLTVGTVVALVVPPGYAPMAGHVVGRTAGKAVGDSGVKPSGDFDTGVGGSMAVYCGIIGVVMLADVTLHLLLEMPRACSDDSASRPSRTSTGRAINKFMLRKAKTGK